MFTADDIQQRITNRPFVPLRVVTSGGESYDVYHSDLVLIGRRSIMVGSASSRNPRQYEQVSRVAIMHITALEDLPMSTTSEGDGHS